MICDSAVFFSRRGFGVFRFDNQSCWRCGSYAKQPEFAEYASTPFRNSRAPNRTLGYGLRRVREKSNMIFGYSWRHPYLFHFFSFKIFLHFQSNKLRKWPESVTHPTWKEGKVNSSKTNLSSSRITITIDRNAFLPLYFNSIASAFSDHIVVESTVIVVFAALGYLIWPRSN